MTHFCILSLVKYDIEGTAASFSYDWQDCFTGKYFQMWMSAGSSWVSVWMLDVWILQAASTVSVYLAIPCLVMEWTVEVSNDSTGVNR